MSHSRSLFVLLIVFCLVLGTNAHAQRYLMPLGFGTSTTLDVSYGSAPNWDGSTQALAMDVYEPTADTLNLRPFILVLHGGSFIGGQRNDAPSITLCETFASRGYVAATASYRIGVNFNNLANIQEEFVRAALRATHDAKAAVRFIRRSVAEQGNPYGIDTNRIYVGGYSAGAIAAIHLAFFEDTTLASPLIRAQLAELGVGLEGNSGNAGYSSKAYAVLNLAGAVLDTAIMPANPVTGIHFHGTADNVVPYGRDFVRASGFPVVQMDGSSLLHARLENLGTYSELITFTDGGHDLFTPAGQSNSIISNSVRFFYNLQNNSVSVPETQQARIRSYPNPTAGTLYFQDLPAEGAQLQLRDMQGRLLKQTQLFPGDLWQLDGYAPGIYLLSWTENGKQIHQKIILQSK